MAVEYKFKPYTPKNLKIASPQSSLSQEEKTLKSLQSQRANLDARLRAEGIDPDTLGGEFDNRGFLEKALNLRPKQGVLMDFLEVINRPLEATKSGLLALVEGENVFEGYYEGLSGQAGEGQEWGVRGSEFLKRLTGIEAKTDVGKFITDVGVDILLDPLTYLPPGLIIKGFSKLGKLGGKTILRESITQALQLTAKKQAIEFGQTVLTRAQALVDDVASPIKNLDDGIREVLKEFSGVNLRDVYYFDRTFDSADELIELVAKGDVSEVILTQSGKGDPILKKKIKATKEALDPNYVPTGPANKAEVEAFVDRMKMYQELEKLDPNFKVILNQTADKFDDVAMYYKVTIDGKDALVKIQSLEVKSMVGKAGKRSKAFFSNPLIRNVGGELSLAAGTTMGRNMQNIFLNGVKAVKVTDTKAIARAVKLGIIQTGETLTLSKHIASMIPDIMKAKGTKGLNLSDLRKLTDADGQKALREIFENIAKESPMNYTYIVTPTGSKYVKVSEHLDMFEDSMNIFFDKTQNQVRFRTGFDIARNADFAGIPNYAQRMFDDIAQRVSTNSVEEVFLTFAGRIREGEFGAIAQKIAVSIKNLEINFKLAFNLTGGFSNETKELVKKALGENLFELERRSARLAELQKELIKIDPEAGRLLGELVEAGAKIGPDGKIVKLARRMGTSDFLDYIYKRTADKVEVLLPSFADDAAQSNFLKNLNKMFQDMSATTDDFFSVITKDGGTVLKFDGSLDDVQDLIKYYNEKTVLAGVASTRGIPEYLEFGEKALSSKARRLLETSGDLIGEYRQLGDEILQELIDVAGFDNLPRELANQIGYMRHMMTREAYEGMVKQLGEVSSIFARPGTDALKKRTFIGSVEEINAGLRAFMGLEMDLFDPNAFNAMEDLIKISQRKLDQYRMLDIILSNKGIDSQALMRVVPNTKDFAKTLSPYDRMFKNFKEEFGALYENLSPAGKQRLDEFFKASGYGDNSAIVMNKSAFNVLKGAEKAYLDLPPLVKVYDKFLNTWKGLTLVSPGFHLRNMFGNMFNSYAVGMGVADQGKYLTKSLMELDQFQKVGKKLAKGEKITEVERKLFETVRGYFEQGVSQTHRGIRDLEQLKTGVDAARKGGKLKTGYNNVLRFNFNVAEKMDDVQRYALYRWGLDKTGDAGKAARTVSEALFDYSHLTPFEKNYMKRIFPFYTFMKNNFIFQAKNIFANPKQYARVGRAYRYAVEDLGGYNLDDLPDYAVENMWIPIPMTLTKNDKDAVAFLKANLPLSDFTELIENPFKKGVISVTAPVKLLIEFGAGRDLFTGAPLEQFPGEKNALEEGTGVLSGLRDRRGNLTISQSPLFQKILNDIGLRTPINVASAGLDIVDTLAGYQGPKENLGDFLQRAGLAGVQEVENLELTELYQDLERLRELKKFYEQETGNQLPILPRG
jgi:hypothetical protein